MKYQIAAIANYPRHSKRIGVWSVNKVVINDRYTPKLFTPPDPLTFNSEADAIHFLESQGMVETIAPPDFKKGYTYYAPPNFQRPTTWGTEISYRIETANNSNASSDSSHE